MIGARWIRIVAIVSLVALVLTIPVVFFWTDVVVLVPAGTIALAIIGGLGRTRDRTVLFVSLGLVLFSAIAAVYIGTTGGLGPRTGRSLLWSVLFLPFPIGWIMAIVGAILTIRNPRTAGGSTGPA